MTPVNYLLKYDLSIQGKWHLVIKPKNKKQKTSKKKKTEKEEQKYVTMNSQDSCSDFWNHGSVSNKQDQQCSGNYFSVSKIAQSKAFEMAVLRCQRSMTMKNTFAESSETKQGGGEGGGTWWFNHGCIIRQCTQTCYLFFPLKNNLTN